MSSRTTKTVAFAALVAVSLLASAAPASLAEGPDNCPQVYTPDHNVGPVTVHGADDCYKIEYNEDWQPATTASEPKCYQIYLGEYEAGPVTVDASDSCPEVTVDEPTTTQTIPPCAGGDGALVDKGPVYVGLDPYCRPVIEIDKPNVTTTNCLQIIFKVQAGPVTVYGGCTDKQSQVDEDWNPLQDDDNLPEFCAVNAEESAGPVTVSDTCGDGDAVEGNAVQTSSSPPACFYLYYEKEAGPVTVTLTSTCSADVDVDGT